jgi:hypothetical protein
MAVDFLTAEQKAEYGQFCGEPNEIQLTRYFHLDEADMTLILNRRGNQNRLGFALQLTTARFLGTFISDISFAPVNAQTFVARQLSITDMSVLENYAQRETTKREHTAVIRKQYGYHEFNESSWGFRLSRLLYIRACVSNERPSLMFDFATAWLIQNKILLPGVSTLSRLISEIRERAVIRLWKQLSLLPTKEQKEKLETLLQVPEGERISRFDCYRKGPVTISSPAFTTAVERYIEFKAFGLHNIDFSRILPVRLKNLARHAGVISMHKIARMPDDKRIAILVAFVKAFEVMALDDAVDILDLLITGIAGEAKKLGQKKRLRTLKDLDKSALALAAICAFILNEEIEDSQLREVIHAKLSKENMDQSIDMVNEIARPSSNNFHDEMVE